MEMEENFDTVIIKVEPQDDGYENVEPATSKDAQKVVESLQKVQTECEETDLDDAGLRDIVSGIDVVDDFEVSAMEAIEIKMEIQDDIDLIERDEYEDSTACENDSQLRKEIQEDIELIERNEYQNNIVDENDDRLCAELANLDENGIVELVERDVLDLVRNNVSEDADAENMVDVREEEYPENATYFCALCEQSIKGGTLAKAHLLGHIEKEKYSCMECDEVYLSNCFKVKHCLVQYQDIGKSSRGKLYKYYSTPQLLRNEHLNSVADSKSDIVVIEKGEAAIITKFAEGAQKISKLKTDVIVSNAPVQRRKKRRKGPIVCLECHRTFTLIDHLRIHNLNVHDNQNGYICPNCNTTFPDEKKLKSHLKTYGGKGCQIHLCTFCNKIFRKADPMKSHMFTHTGRGSFECEQCGKTWKTRSILTRHIQSHWTEKIYRCSVCDKYFATANSLKMHMNIHTAERSFPCPLCPKVFAEKRFLRAHMCIHTGEGKYMCTICPKRYYSSSQLKLHMCKHTGERPHVCQICNESFLVRTSLQRHMYKHNGVKPFSCNTCGKKFVLKQDMHEHLKTHLARPYACSLCSQAFTTGAYLNRHLKQHMSRCRFCDKLLSTKQMLIVHELTCTHLKVGRDVGTLTSDLPQD